MTREEVIALTNSVGFVLADNACDEAVDRFRALIQVGQKIEGNSRVMIRAGTRPAPCARHCEAPAFQSEIRRLSTELESARSELAQLRGISTLAFRALNDVGPVLATIDGEDYSESYMLAELIDKVKACSMNLWCALRGSAKQKATENKQ